MINDVPGLDVPRLATYLRDTLPGRIGPDLHAEVIAGGKSNLTYRVSDGATSWVVRRPPLGHVLPTAHDMTREHRVLSALAPTAVPVPQPIALCTDDDVIGAPFYVMEYVPGTVYRSLADTRDLDGAAAHRLTLALLEVLTALHDVDTDEVGLADFGRPQGYLQRQLRRWRAQLDASRSRPLPGIDDLHDQLTSGIPQSPAPAIVHGDYRLDNVIVTGDHHIAAVVDWEMATVGDPLADLGLCIAYWDGLSAIPGSVSEAVGPLSPFPRADVIADGYARRRGADLTNLPWYVAFGYFKLAVITEGIHYRHVHGQTVGEGFEGLGEHTPTLIGFGHDALAALPRTE